MLPRKEIQDRILLAVAIAAAGFIQISIAASQILLGIGILLILIFRQKLNFPRIWVPLVCLFFGPRWRMSFRPIRGWGARKLKSFLSFSLFP